MAFPSVKDRRDIILKKLAASKPTDRKKILVKCNNKILKDIKQSCNDLCHKEKFKNSKIIKKGKKFKKIIRSISNSKSLKRVKGILLNKNRQYGKGIFSLLAGVIVPSLIKVISDHV